MCGNDDDPTMDLSVDFGPDPRLQALAPPVGRTVADELEVTGIQSPEDVSSRTAPPAPGPDRS